MQKRVRICKKSVRRKRETNRQLIQNQENKSYSMSVDKILKFYSQNVDESRYLKKKYWIMSIVVLFIAAFLINYVFNQLNMEDSYMKLIVLFVITLVLTYIMDRLIHSSINKEHKVDIKSYFFPNSNLYEIKVNAIKSFLISEQLFDLETIRFLINHFENGLKNKSKIVFPMKSEFMSIISSITIMIITLTFTFSFAMDPNNGLKQLSEFFGYFTVTTVMVIFVLLMISNIIYQIFTPQSVKVKEVIRLLVQIYLNF